MVTQTAERLFDNSAIADKPACQCCATVSALNPVDGEIYTSSRSALKNGSMKQELTT
jgi:hypothetical protein